MDIFVDFANYLIEMIGGALGWVVDLLPDSPADSFKNDRPDGIELGYITWFIPFPTMISHFAVFLTSLAVYYLYRIVARWLKVVRG